MDADMLANVEIGDSLSLPSICTEGTIAGALAWIYEETTYRPIVADVTLCLLYQDLPTDLEVVAHELLHALVCTFRFCALGPFRIDAASPWQRTARIGCLDVY